MITKINVPKTSIVIEIENKEIKIENMIEYDINKRRISMSSLTLSLDVSTTGTGWAVFDGSTLIQSGVSKPKQKSFYERAKAMASELKTIQLRAIQKYDKPFEDIVIEQNTVLGPNQQSSIKIGIATGIILGKLLAEEIYFVNVSTWRKYWKFSYKDRSKKSMKQQAINAVATEFDKQVKDDEADAILIGSYFVNFGKEYGDLESHKGS